mmetsp:Transcript_39191/g.57631  ORF Transcript_39191/g.57631 Transcript_39191/m.57631 type:complete len:417 (-) Transcript_39191:80-1330(-)
MVEMQEQKHAKRFQHKIVESTNENDDVASSSGDDLRETKNVSCNDEMSVIATYLQEISSLKAAIQTHEEQYTHLKHSLQEQTNISSQILSQQDEILLKQMNELEFNSKLYKITNDALVKRVQNAQRDVSTLERVTLLHPLLFNIVLVDDVTISVARGNNNKKKKDSARMHDTINALRLAHAPSGVIRGSSGRDSNSLGWEEINAAWSQATQLLLFAGGMIKFTSRDLRIVPLASCAKIIQIDPTTSKKNVLNLGNELPSNDDNDHNHHHLQQQRHMRNNDSNAHCDGMYSALRAFHSLLYQLYLHFGSSPSSPFAASAAKNETNDNHFGLSSMWTPPPYEMTVDGAIGNVNISQLLSTTIAYNHHGGSKEDDNDWRQVVHMLTANLKWVAEMASLWVNTEMKWENMSVHQSVPSLP